MAFKHGLSERLDELRFPSPRSPPSESAFPGYTSLSPGHSNFGSGFSSRPAGDVRANLQRRFTTDSSKFSSWNYLNPSSGSGSSPSSGSGQMQDPLDLLSSFEKKRQHIEYMREQKRRFEEDMKMLDLQHAREKLEMDQLARDLAQAGISGPVSEPTTPPEYRDTSVSSAFSRPARFSTSSVTSSPGFFNAFAPSNLTSPQAASQPSQPSIDRFAGHSVPGSRRNSEKDDFLADPASPFRSGPSAAHRYSLPSGNPNGQSHRSSISGLTGSRLDSFNIPKYLFPSDEDKPHSHLRELERLSTPDIKSYIKLTEPDDKFPTLSRRGDSNMLSANPDAHDLANPRAPGSDNYTNHSRHRSSHQSMPQNIHNFGRLDQVGSQNNEDHGNSVHTSRHGPRRSIGSQISFHDDRHDETATPVPSSRPTALQSSYSTNDLPTIKGNGAGNAITPPKAHNEHIHHHNASMGRVLQNGVNNQAKTEFDETEFYGNQSTLHASAPPFGPQLSSAAPTNHITSSTVQMGLPFQVPAVPAFNYGLQSYVGQATPVNGHMQNFGGASAYNNAYPGYGPGFRFNEPAARGSMAQRRQENDATQLTRFGNYPLEHYKGELYSLCKDQHGCRYLQRKLEERNPEHVQLIFSETYMHVIELMTDPFGNYLCQKLLEYSNDEQRTALIDNAAPELVKIALNQHGTRALQKMIEFISTPQQTQTVINALQYHVVDLVQDLNGNHVIQKCLNRLTPEDAEFIYEAVGGNCVVVGTHRHGCCVLQRCIDHASGHQKARLISQITSHSFALVQDPFGNYVVQYILDLAEPSFTNPLCATFGGNIPQLSKQKFSSNVIEKCLRTADNYMKREMIDEFLMGSELEKMLRDSFANYVVQTAMDFCDLDTRNRIVEAVRPILPSIRQTPHGRRIAGKIMAADTNSRSNGSSATTSGQVTPNEITNSAQIPKTLLQKPFTYHQPGTQSSSSSSGYSTHTYVPQSSQSSVSNTPSGQSDTSSVYAAPTSQLSVKLGPQQIQNYF
ncbi:Armadillo-like helical [Penicillium fimorum]|uniref:Armadillo-like helical n=1 Tax=Penicillium fimorum TaxID=1882269 RepID=A0A9W9XSD4_9EURO|nr:Armadillo-like helical [Penicillium fimorum]